MKREDQKPYDSKKSVWIPNPKRMVDIVKVLESEILRILPLSVLLLWAMKKFTQGCWCWRRLTSKVWEVWGHGQSDTSTNDALCFGTWRPVTRLRWSILTWFLLLLSTQQALSLYTHRVSKIYLGKRRMKPHLIFGLLRWPAEVCCRTRRIRLCWFWWSGAGKTENTKKALPILPWLLPALAEVKEESFPWGPDCCH